jgi:glycosyltransferase involved in cell wall biosynthesis
LGYVDLNIRPFQAFYHLFSPHSYVVRRFESEDFRKKLHRILSEQEFDIIQLETLYLTPYVPDIRELSQAKIVLRSHNIEHQIWKRHAQNSRNPLIKFYLKHLSKELEHYELSHINDYDGILPITSVDAQFYQQHQSEAKTKVHTFALDTGKIPGENPERKTGSIFHLGSMDWLPNLEGIDWFLEHVWPGLRKQNPSLNFSLAGRNMPNRLKQLKLPGLQIDGEVEDAYEYMQLHSIMVVPLFSGSGIRIKILEGMLNGNTIITTSIGAEGIEFKENEHLLIADSAEAFRTQLHWCAEHPKEAEKIGRQARQLVLSQYDLRHSAQRLTEFYHSIL